MARPIRTHPTPGSGTRTEIATPPPSIERVAPVDAVRDFLEVLQALEERGYLRFASDLVRSEDQVVQVLTERVDPARLRKATHGLSTALSVLGELDRSAVEDLAPRLAPALEEAVRAESGPALGPLELLQALNEPDVNRGLRMLLGFLRGFGRGPGP